MKKITTILLSSFLFVVTASKAQTTAMDFDRNDCNGTKQHLFQDLDNGMAVVLFYYMPNCGSCPPPAKKVQAMLNNINTKFPGKVKGYAIPYNNTTQCTSIQSWVSTNALSLFAPMDSGAIQVAYYGGFGMPTVVLVGGINHRVMFSTQNFVTSDTTVMRDSIVNMLNGTTGIYNLPAAINSFNVYPNPASTQLTISLNLKENTQLNIDIADITGKTLYTVVNEKISAGTVAKQVNTSELANGNYLVRINSNGNSISKKITITH